MKIFLGTILLLLFSFCKKKDTKPKPLNELFDASQSTLIKQGSLNSNAHSVSGTIKLYKTGGLKTLSFENFSSESGPDLKVYLSTSTGNNDVKELGALKANAGNFYYQFDSSIKTTTYNYVLVWCKQYSVLFGNTKLQ